MDITDVGPLGGTGGRATAVGHIISNALDPDGATSIGAGVLAGKDTLDDGQAAASPAYDVLAMVVLTDGVQNTAPTLADVAPSISANTFAIGLGLPSNISVAALTQLTQGHNGYLLVTGELTTDQRTRLTKYFLQVLAGVTNASIVVDPSGELTPGEVHRIPFELTEADYGLDVFVLTPYPKFLECALQAPDGTVVDAGVLTAEGTGELAVRPGLWLYRLALPAVPSRTDGTHDGRWHVLLRLGGRPKLGHYASEYRATTQYAAQALPYDVIVHAYSSLELRGWLTQTDFAPGSIVTLRARVLEYTRVLTRGADVWAEVTGPDGATAGVAMASGADGTFGGAFVAALPGVYRARIRARGTTTDGSPFTRETTLTAVARVGGGSTPDGHDPWCEALRCLLKNPKLVERLGPEAREFLECLAVACRRHHPADLERRRSVTAMADPQWRPVTPPR